MVVCQKYVRICDKVPKFHVLAHVISSPRKSIIENGINKFTVVGKIETWPCGYKTYFTLNSTEHEISTAHKD